MNLVTEPYLVQAARWPTSGRHILAQFDDDSVIVYQAYRTAISHLAAKNGFFGGQFSLNRMSWIKVSARDSQGTARREPGLGCAIAVDQSGRPEGGVASVVAL
jgi:Domain of unknown function (DUF4291)